MARKTKVRKDVGRPAGRKPLLNLRVDPALHERLKAAAGKSGFTVAEETVRRLGRTFAEEDTFGPDIRRIGEMMTSAFWFAGHQAASRDTGIEGDDWVRHQDCYRQALLAVAEALFAGMPDATSEETILTLEALKGRLATRLIAQGKLAARGAQK